MDISKLPERFKSETSISGPSDLIMYSDAIKYALLTGKLYKYAQSAKLLSILDRLGINDELRGYVLSLPGDYQGFAVGKINKNKSISKIELELYITEIKKKEELKTKTRENIGAEIPDSQIPGLKNWLIIQIKKFPQHKDFLISHIQPIETLVDSYGLDLASYDAKSMIKALHDNHQVMKNERLTDYSSIDGFFLQVRNRESELISENMNSGPMMLWAQHNFFRMDREWRADIEKYCRAKSKSFDDVLAEGKAILDAQQRGEFRGQEMPNTPLHNAEHSLLMSNVAFLFDWYESASPDLAKMSVYDVVAASKAWHKEQASKGNGKEYDPIKSANIVYGPDNWDDEKNTGYFILELKSDNDLKTEGFKMNHCVGNYCDALKKGETRIFSLRNQSAPNDPILTIETDPFGMIIRQEYGNGNSKPESKFQEMVDEWSGKTNGNIDINKLSSRDLGNLAEKTKDSELLREIINSKNSVGSSQYIVLANPACPIDILEEYAKRDNDNYCSSIAMNPNATETALYEISKQYNGSKGISGDVALEVIKNPNITDKIILDMLMRQSGTIKSWLGKIVVNLYSHNKNLLEQIYDNINQEVNDLIDATSNTNPKILTDLFDRKDYDINMLLAKNPNISGTLINDMLVEAENNRYFAENLITNPKITSNELSTLTEKTSRIDILSLIVDSPKASLDILHKILKEMSSRGEMFMNGRERNLANKTKDTIQKRFPKTATKIINMFKLAKDFETAATIPDFTVKNLENNGPVSQDSRPQVGKDGVKRYFNSFGKPHRIGGPAVESPDGNSLYYEYGKLHREDGPAATFFNGTEKWFIDGNELSPLEVLRLQINKGKISTHDIDTLKELAEVAFFDYAKTEAHAIKQAGELLKERGCIGNGNMHTIVAFLNAVVKL